MSKASKVRDLLRKGPSEAKTGRNSFSLKGAVQSQYWQVCLDPGEIPWNERKQEIFATSNMLKPLQRETIALDASCWA